MTDKCRIETLFIIQSHKQQWRSHSVTHPTFPAPRLTSSPPPRGILQRIPGSVRCLQGAFTIYKNPCLSRSPSTNHDHLYFPPTKASLLSPGNTSRGCRCFSLSECTCSSFSHRFSDTVHSAPPPLLKWFTQQGGAQEGCHYDFPTQLKHMYKTFTHTNQSERSPDKVSAFRQVESTCV